MPAAESSTKIRIWPYHGSLLSPKSIVVALPPLFVPSANTRRAGTPSRLVVSAGTAPRCPVRAARASAHRRWRSCLLRDGDRLRLLRTRDLEVRFHLELDQIHRVDLFFRAADDLD